MYVAINGTYENGKITLDEPAPNMQKTKVIITFLTEVDEAFFTNEVSNKLRGL